MVELDSAKRDPLVQAEILLRYGRKQQALALLRAALHVHPERADLRAKLHLLEHEPQTNSGKQRKYFHHLLMAWVMLIASLLLMMTVVCVLPVALTAYLSPEFSEWMAAPADEEGTKLLLMLVALVVGLVVSVFLAIQLFLRLWFSYLKRLPDEVCALAEQKLPELMQVRMFEPHYSAIRRRVL